MKTLHFRTGDIFNTNTNEQNAIKKHSDLLDKHGATINFEDLYAPHVLNTWQQKRL